MYVNLFKTDKGFAPIFTDHEPVMFLLHQSAKKNFLIKTNEKKNIKYL